MQSENNKKINKISLLNTAISNMADFPKKMLKYAVPAVLCLVILGASLFIYNRTGGDYSFYSEFVSQSLILNSFTVLVEFFIAAFVVDILTKKRNGSKG